MMKYFQVVKMKEKYLYLWIFWKIIKKDIAYMFSHKKILYDKILQTCFNKGKELYICEFCGIKVEDEVDIVPHKERFFD